MNFRIVFKFLGAAAFFLGVCMLLCLPWASVAFGGNWRFEARGAAGLFCSALVAFAVGIAFRILGRGADGTRLFRKEAIAIVSLSWATAVVLGALPYLLSGAERAPGVPLSPADALFESVSGFTTTGATIFAELENPATLPRTILFWRGATHFLGGLGVVCFFVVLLGRGARGKAVLKLERSLNGSVPIAKTREITFSLIGIYVGLNALCFLGLTLFGMNVFDAISHSFSAVASGGFSSRNASVGYFATAPGCDGLAIELILIVFTILSGTNFWLIYWLVARRPEKLWRDTEWRTFVAFLAVGTILTTAFGVLNGDFSRRDAETAQVGEFAKNGESARIGEFEKNGESARIGEFAENGESARIGEIAENDESAKNATSWRDWATGLRKSAFSVVSLSTGTGFATDRFERWNAATLTILLILMFCGACSGSASGGAKIVRIVLAAKTLFREAERLRSPNVVRATRLDGENVDKETTSGAFVYLVALVFLIAATSVLVAGIEPNDVWSERGETQIDKFVALTTGTLAMFANVGPGFGAVGSLDNYGALTETTKFVFCWAMALGRLEIWAVLTLFAPSFWRNR